MAEEIFGALVSGFLTAWRKTENATLVSHWFQPYKLFDTSPKDFYDGVERAVNERELPQLSFSRVVWKERGLLSANRLYLRIEWKRYICDICAAPYGTGFFFSYWLVLLPRVITLFHLAGMATTLGVLPVLLIREIGMVRGLTALVFLVAFVGWLLRTGRLQLEHQLEEFLLGLTVIGPIWDRFWRPITYFEIDTASMFLSATHQAVLDVVDEVTKMKGLEPLSDAERKPVMRDFFKR